MAGQENGAAIRRLARFVGARGAGIAESARPGVLLLDGGERGVVSTERHVVAQMMGRGLLELAGDRLRLSPRGRQLIADDSFAPDALGAARREIGAICIDDGTGPQRIAANLSESPLTQIARRRGVDGKPFLDDGEVSAGERLRTDYTRGQIMPRLGANWVAAVASGKRGGSGGTAELTDSALAARLRVEKAIEAVGPELSGVLIDICCYLKGLERVEAERGWPARSGKIVLKSALGVLSRHYQPRSEPSRHRRVLQWGAEDFRPSLRGAV